MTRGAADKDADPAMNSRASTILYRLNKLNDGIAIGFWQIVELLGGAIAIRLFRVAMPEALSDHEKDVIIALVQGMSNKEIADHLCISTNTVITHRRNIARKLQIHSPAGLTIYAIVNGLVDISAVKI